MSQRVVLVAAVAANGVIGRDGQLPWRIPEDLAHFRRVTTGHVVVMGRKTFESMGRPLPRRTNIVVTRRPDWVADGVVVAHSLESALETASTYDGDVMVIGGGEIYRQAMAYADAQVLTEVHDSPDGDAHFPTFDADEWLEVEREKHDGFDFVWWERAHPR
jgi:dihydrofolate reductase